MILPGKTDRIAGKAVIGVLVAWVVTVIYSAEILNPAGIAAGVEQGTDSPAMYYDNNTVASAILGGWLYPTLASLAFGTFRNVLRKKGKEAVQYDP